MTWPQDLRFAFRIIRKSPWFSLAIVAMLGLGIGVNTTVFTLVNAVLRKPLPFPGGERLVTVRSLNVRQGEDSMNISYPDFLDFRQGTRTFEYLEAVSPQRFRVSEKGNPPESYRGALISAGLFDMIRVKPIVGRGFTAADARPGADRVALIGYGVWNERYGRQNVLGRTVRINDQPAVIVGVMQEGFKFPVGEDIWMPLVSGADWDDRGRRNILAIGMRKSGAGLAEASAELNGIALRNQREYPKTNKDMSAVALTFHQTFNAGRIRIVFLLMLGAVGFVLLIACANVANLLLSRAVARKREISVRAALGASRWRVIRQLLVESVLLAVAGGLIGLFLAVWGARAFNLAVADVGKPYWIDFSMDYMVFLYFAAVSLVSGILFGLAPAFQSSRVDLIETLKEGSRSAGGLRGGRLTGALVVFQFTLALILLSGAGLMMRSFQEHQDRVAGVPAGRILAVDISLPDARFPKPEERVRFYERIVPSLASIPGVEAVAHTTNTPGSGYWGRRMEIEGNLIAEPERRPAAGIVYVSPNYLKLIGASLLRGRDFVETDGLPGREAIIVSRRFAERFWPVDNPLGRRVRFYADSTAQPWATVIGVVSDFVQASFNETQDPVAFAPYRQQAPGFQAVLIRTPGRPGALAAEVRRRVNQVDEELPLANVLPLSDRFARERWHLRVFGTLFSIFATLALMMAAMGMYAVMAHAAVRRTQEIGVRMALGASGGNILRLVVGRGVKQLVAGMVLGLAAALGVTQLMTRIIIVSPRDPVTFALVGAVLGGAGLLACWLPARRASTLDPVKALRYE
ncbi:MAG: ABC transporter permease [Bryobacteraceae bacterium]